MRLEINPKTKELHLVMSDSEEAAMIGVILADFALNSKKPDHIPAPMHEEARNLAGVLSGQIHRANEWLCSGGLTTPMADPRVSDPPDVREVTKFFKPSS